MNKKIKRVMIFSFLVASVLALSSCFDALGLPKTIYPDEFHGLVRIQLLVTLESST